MIELAVSADGTQILATVQCAIGPSKVFAFPITATDDEIFEYIRRMEAFADEHCE